MPHVSIEVRSGRDPDSIRRLISAVTEAVVSSLGTPHRSVRVIVTEVPTTHWANGDVTLAESAHQNGASDG